MIRRMDEVLLVFVDSYVKKRKKTGAGIGKCTFALECSQYPGLARGHKKSAEPHIYVCTNIYTTEVKKKKKVRGGYTKKTQEAVIQISVLQQ